MTKPSWCRENCPFASHSTGFVEDWSPLIQIGRPLFAVILKMPGKDELVHGSPMTDKAGRYWEREFLWPLGVSREQVLIANVIRCFPHGGEFPKGTDKTSAVRACRHWDDKIIAYNPNVWGVTFNPAALLRSPQQTRMMYRALKRARDLGREGFRPVLLMGEEAADTYAPWLRQGMRNNPKVKGFMKTWQGHWDEYTIDSIK